MSMKDKIVALAEAVIATRMCFPEAARELTYSTREMHRQLTTRRVFVGEDQEKNGWKLLAKLVDYEFPGVRRGAETQSAWRGNKKPVRPLEWHRTPTPAELAEWKEKVRSHKAAGPIAGLNERLEDFEARLDKLEEQMRNLLASPAAPVAR